MYTTRSVRKEGLFPTNLCFTGWSHSPLDSGRSQPELETPGSGRLTATQNEGCTVISHFR